jgi:hypothetical protein
MFAAQAIIIPVCLAVLAICLCIKLRRWESEAHKPAQLTGKSIDAAELKRNLDHVRRDYLAARRRARGVCFHRALLSLARRTVVRLPYFRNRKAEEDAHTHGP